MVIFIIVHQHDVAASRAVVVAMERTGTPAQIPADQFVDCMSHIFSFVFGDQRPDVLTKRCTATALAPSSSDAG